MKNTLLIWNILLTAIIGYLLFQQFGTKDGNKKNGTNAAKIETANKNFRVAYFDMDTVESNFTLVKEVKAELSKKEDAIHVEVERMTKNIQMKYQNFQTQAQEGKLSPEQQESAGRELKTMDDQLKSKKQVLDQEYSDYYVKKMKEIKTKIKDYINEYNKTANYSYIVSYGESDGLFYFKDTTYNITDEVVKGLNRLYSSNKK